MGCTGPPPTPCKPAKLALARMHSCGRMPGAMNARSRRSLVRNGDAIGPGYALDVHHLVVQHPDVFDGGFDPVARQAVAAGGHQARQRLPLAAKLGIH